MFYRVGEKELIALNPESAITRLSVSDDQIVIYPRTGRTITVDSTQWDYAGYLELIASSPYLSEELQVQSLRTIRHTHTHPLLDELPPTLFAVFQSMRGSEQMELRLTDVGAGSLWTKGPDARCVLQWADLNEGLYRLLKAKEGCLSS